MKSKTIEIEKQSIEDAAIKHTIDRHEKKLDEPWSDSDEKEAASFTEGAMWMKSLLENKEPPACQDRNVTDKYKYCNHHHELTDEHEIVDFGDGEFVANKAAIPILKALNEAGLKTRTHHMDGNGGFISILLSDKVECEIQLVNEIYAERIRYNGMKEVLIKWSN